MKQIVDSVRKCLRNDVLVKDFVGLDQDDEVKVYEEIAKKDTEPPFIVWSVAPGGDGLGTYGEKYTIHIMNAQVSSWHREPKRAWQLSDLAEEALEKGDYDSGPYEFMQVRRLAFPQPVPDRDTGWFQIALTLQFHFSGPGITQ